MVEVDNTPAAKHWLASEGPLRLDRFLGEGAAGENSCVEWYSSSTSSSSSSSSAPFSPWYTTLSDPSCSSLTLTPLSAGEGVELVEERVVD